MGKKKVPNYRRRTLRLADLDHSKLAVLNSLGSPGSRRVYEFALDGFIAWYCSEPRLAFNRIVVTRYHIAPRIAEAGREHHQPAPFKAYQSILKEHPEARRSSLDDLVVKMQNGELAKYIEKATAKCGKHI